MAISVPPRHRFNWTSPRFLALVAVIAVVSLSLAVALGIGAFRNGGPSGGPVAFSPSPTSSTSPAPASPTPATPSESPSPSASPSASATPSALPSPSTPPSAGPSPSPLPTPITAAPTGYPVLYGWDGVDHQVVMAGLHTGGMVPRRDSSTMVFVDGRWLFAPAAKTIPSEYLRGLLVYDSDRNRELFIATVGMLLEPLDVWEWDGTTWIKKTAGPPIWDVGESASAAYSPALHATVLWDPSYGNSPTRIWDGSAWHSVKTPHRPATGSALELAYDPTRKSIVALRIADFTTWVFDGADWTQLPLAGDTPRFRVNSGVAFDPRAGRWVLFGGAVPAVPGAPVTQPLDDTWTGDETSWTQLAPALSPSPRTTRMVFDPDHQRIVLFGGLQGFENPLADTWAWEGGTWRQLAP